MSAGEELPPTVARLVADTADFVRQFSDTARSVRDMAAPSHVAPTAVYARIQELGGMTGRGHRTRLPARPYVHPALVASREQMRRAAARAFRRALEGA